MDEVKRILEAHNAITRIKGKEYAPSADEIQEWLNENNKHMVTYQRKAISDMLKTYCTMSKEHDFIEVCEWYNGEGFDVEIGTSSPCRFQLTWGQLEALNTLIKELDKENEK